MERTPRYALALFLAFTLSSCTFNPFTTDNKTTGNMGGAAAGAAIGGGSAALLGAPKPVIALMGAGGAALGYYVTTLRFDAAGIVDTGGQVYTLGDFATINMPSDKIFDVNSAEFLDDVDLILDSIVAVLKRYPEHSITIAGNTSGFGLTKFERKLSEDRARQIAGYLWSHGITDNINFDMKDGIHDCATNCPKARRLIYVGYGSYFPIANNLHNKSIRQNSRIQITIFPTSAQLEPEKFNKQYKVFHNIGKLDEPPLKAEQKKSQFDNAFSDVLYEERPSPTPPPGDLKGEGTLTDYYHEQPNLKGESEKNYNKVSSAPQTTEGGIVRKHGGVRGLKGEGGGLKDELPR